MPIEHTTEFYERVELLRLESKGSNFIPKLFKKVMDKCLKNCYPDLTKKQIKKYNDKIFFVLVDKSKAKDNHLLNPYGFFTIKVETTDNINKVVIYDLCKSFQGEDNDIICRIMLRKFIEYLETSSFQLETDTDKTINYLIHEVIIYVSKKNQGTLSCYNETGFKSEDRTLIMKNNDEDEEFEEYKLLLPTSKLTNKNENNNGDTNHENNTNNEDTNHENNTNNEDTNHENNTNNEDTNKVDNVKELTPAVLTANNGNNLGSISSQIEEILNNENIKASEEEKENEPDPVATDEKVSNLSNGFSSVKNIQDIEKQNELNKYVESEEEKAKNSSFFGNIGSSITGFFSGQATSEKINSE